MSAHARLPGGWEPLADVDARPRTVSLRAWPGDDSLDDRVVARLCAGLFQGVRALDLRVSTYPPPELDAGFLAICGLPDLVSLRLDGFAVTPRGLEALMARPPLVQLEGILADAALRRVGPLA